jgi:signal transduction histidine kinase
MDIQLNPGIAQQSPSAADQLSSRWVRNSVSQVWITFSIAVAYYLGTKVGFYFTPHGAAIATYWPPNAILLGSFLLLAPRLWYGVILAVLVVHLLVQSHYGVPFSTALGWFASNVSEALLGATLLYRFKGRNLFNSVRGTVYFLVCGVFLAPFATSFLDAAVVVTTHWGRDYWILWLTRLFSNMLAALTIVPAIVIFGSWKARLSHITTGRWIEALLLAVSITVVAFRVYGGYNVAPVFVPVLVYAPMPFLLWASLRFGTGALATSSVMIALISLYNVAHGRGPFTSSSMVENILFLQMLLGMVTVPLMLLNAVLAERRRAQYKLQESKRALIEIQEQERWRIAAELHDDIGQQLSLVQLELHQAREAAVQPNGIDKMLSQLEERVNAVVESTRELSHGLHPVQLEYLGLAMAIRRLCTRVQNEAGIDIRFHENSLPSILPTNISLNLFRVAQEALRNVVKHSQANTVIVEVGVNRARIVLQIADNGCGLARPEERREGLGLINMKERLKSIDGTIAFSSTLKKGTTITASVPFR